MHRGGVSVGIAALLAQRTPILERSSSGRIRSVLLAGAFVAVAALVMFAAVIEAPLTMRLVLHSALLALGVTLIARGWLQSRQERGLLDRERLARHSARRERREVSNARRERPGRGLSMRRGSPMDDGFL